MIRFIHWRDDFSLTETFYRDDGSGRTAIPVPEHVEICYFTPVGHGRFVASRNGNVFENCSLSADGYTLTVNLSLRSFPVGHGRLLRIATVITEDPAFPGGLKYTRFPSKLDVVLYDGKSDGPLDIASDIIFNTTILVDWSDITGKPDFGQAAFRDIGTIEAGNGGLVTGGDVFSLFNSYTNYINEALENLDIEIAGDLTQITHRIEALESLFEEINLGTEDDPAWAVRLKKKDGILDRSFVTYGDQIVVGGEPGGGGGGGGVQYLHELLDVDIDDTTIVPGQILVWDGEKWVNEDPSEGSVTSVVLEQGDSDGTFHLVVNGVAGTDVPVKGLDDSLSVISRALQSFQSQIDAVSARDMFDELTATVVSSDVLTATEAYMGYAHASRYYLTDSIYFWAESVNGVMCVRLNAPLITDGDQIVISGTPGGGGGGGASYLDELLDVTITLPSNGQALFYQDGVWVNGNIDFSNYYTKAQVDDIIGTIQQFHYEVYASLEDVTDPQNNVLYLIGPTGSGEDKYEEYVYSGGWVKIGDTSIDLSGYVQTTRLDADEAIIAEAIQSLQSQIDAVSARDNYDELTASALYADMLAATYAYAERYYLTDGVFFYIEAVNGIPCVKLNAPFITEGDQVIISGTPGGGGGGGITLYDYDQVKAMTADVALTAPSAWAMHQMWAEIFGGASSVLTSDNYTNYVNTTNFPGLDKVGTVTSVATGTGLTGGPITASGTISIDPTYLGYISHGETAYGWGDILTQAIQSLQSQIDSVSTRNNYDELTASAFFGDMISASALYAGSVELAGEDLGTAVTGIRTRLSSVESKFDADGSALSAVKLKTSRNIWGRPFDGTADVTGDLNLNGSSILGTLGNPVLSMAGMNGNYWVALGSMYFEARRYNPMIVGHTYISGSSATPSSVPSETLFVNGTSAFDGNVEIKTGRTLTIGGAVFTWVPAEGDTPGYLRLSTAFVTEGDQIILSGTPGGGGQGVGYLYELEDVSDELATPTTGMVLYYDGTEWIGVAATEIGGVTSVVGASGDVTVTQIADALTGAGYKLTDTITTSLPWSAITEKPTTLAGYGITDAATASSVTALTARVGTLESNETIISLALQSLQSQVDSVSARNEFDELTATVLFADTLSATSAYIGNITGHLSGNADTASHLIGSSYAVGSATQPVYFSGGLPVSCTYSINAATTSGTAGRLAYYAGANAISDFYNTIGGATQPMYLNAGVPTACTYTLNAALLASSTAGRLAYYSGTNAVSEYYGNIGSSVIPMYLNAGVPTASTSTVGSASLPVYLNAGTITACTAASLFSALGSNTVNNLEVTVAGQLRTITGLYATYDGVGEVISDKFTIVSSAIQSLQSQIDSVATRFGTDECIATTAHFDMLSVGAYIYAGALVTTGDQAVASDATLKKNWRGLNYGIEDIARATAGVFDWKDGHGTSAGTIAQEWKDLIPELVHGEEGGMSLAYGQAAMLNTILLARHETEQDREIRQLKARVDELETRLKIRS